MENKKIADYFRHNIYLQKYDSGNVWPLLILCQNKSERPEDLQEIDIKRSPASQARPLKQHKKSRKAVG